MLHSMLRALAGLGFAGTDASSALHRGGPARRAWPGAGVKVMRSKTSTSVIATGFRAWAQFPICHWVGRGLEFSPTGEFDLPAGLMLRTRDHVLSPAGAMRPDWPRR